MKSRTKTALLATLGVCFALSLGLLAACDDEDHTHVFENWEVVTPATCTLEGTEKGVCSCGETTTRAIAALGHDLKTTVSTATCTEPGFETKQCTRCDFEETDEVPAKGHVRGSRVKLIKMATCEDVGKETAKCSVCGVDYENDIPALGHELVRESVIEEPTCTEAGMETVRCTRRGCSEEGTREIPALGHDFEQSYTIDEPATFEKAGSRSRHCTRCDAKTDVLALPILKEDEAIQYVFRLVRTNGDLIPFANVKGAVSDGTTTTSFTFRNGKANVPLLPKTYTVTLTDVPDGYTAKASYTVSWENPTCNVTLTGALRTGTPPEKVSYSKCSVMYDFSYTTLATDAREAQTIRLSTLLTTHKAVMLNFWDTACTFCEYEFPGMEAAYQKYKNDIAIIAICDGSLRGMGEDSEDAIVAYANSHHLSFYIVSDYEGLGTKFGLSGNPSTIIIDGEGVVSEIHAGALVNRNDYEDDDYVQAQFEAIFAKYAPTATTSLPALLPARKR